MTDGYVPLTQHVHDVIHSTRSAVAQFFAYSEARLVSSKVLKSRVSIVSSVSAFTLVAIA